MIFSCVNCKNRAAGCHGKCETYKRESEEHRKINETKRADYIIKQYSIEQARHRRSVAYTTNTSNRF